LNGMWAFAILDLREKKLILSRDRFSIKPLHYLSLGNRLYFASEIKQLLAFLPKREINEEQMFVFLEQGIVDYDINTFIKGIKKVEAKHNMIVDLTSEKTASEKYWDYTFKEISDLDSAIDEFRELFFDSVTSSHPFKGWASSFTEESLRGCRGCSPVSAQRPPSPEA